MVVFAPQLASVDQFVTFWSQQYREDIEESHYTSIVRQRPFTPEQIQKLFRWKGGARLKMKTEELVSAKYIPHLDEINSMSLQCDPKIFLNRFAGSGAIWGIFLLHCWQPDKYPIYDQNVHRAMTYIQGTNCEDIQTWSNKRKTTAYFDRYMAFFDEYRTHQNLQKVDRALFQCGKFLKTSTFPDVVKWRAAGD